MLVYDFLFKWDIKLVVRKLIFTSAAFGINCINFLMKMSAQVSCTKVLVLMNEVLPNSSS